MSSSPLIDEAVSSISAQISRAEDTEGASSNPETVALGILALEASGEGAESLRPPRRFLARCQLVVGAVPVDSSMPDAYWPTGWAVLAWRSSAEFRVHRRRAIDFLLRASGQHWPAAPRAALGHDTSLRGWPWTGGTHSWVQPTAVNILALSAESGVQSGRVAQAVKMLLDRQLPDGGWNYGNTRVFHNILRPIPEDTGYALTALRPHAARQSVEPSLSYLTKAVSDIRAPAALAWSVLGLAAWGARPALSDRWIDESLRAQARIGTYPPRYLAQLVIAAYAGKGLAHQFRKEG